MYTQTCVFAFRVSSLYLFFFLFFFSSLEGDENFVESKALLDYSKLTEGAEAIKPTSLAVSEFHFLLLIGNKVKVCLVTKWRSTTFCMPFFTMLTNKLMDAPCLWVFEVDDAFFVYCYQYYWCCCFDDYNYYYSYDCCDYHYQ